jgi:hypothetical protein
MSLLLDIDTKKESKDNLDELFLQSKDIALQPLQMLFEAEVKHERSKKTRHLSVKVNKSIEKDKKTSRTKKRKKTQKSQKSQKSMSNTNKKSHRRKSGHDSQIYNSNIVIVHDEEEESCGDPIEKEVEKLKKLMAKNRRKKKKGTSKSSKSYSASSK